MTNDPSQNVELQINVLAMLKGLWARKIPLAVAAALGLAAGAAWFKLGEKRFSSSISFVQSRAEADLSAVQGLGALSMLGMGASTSEPPLLKFLEKYSKTREFLVPFRDTVYEDSSLFRKLVGTDTSMPGADDAFHSRMSSLFKVEKDAGLVTIKVIHAEPRFAHFLVNSLFASFSRDFVRERRNMLRENLTFVRELVDKNRSDMQRASGAFRIFLEQNRELSAPHVQQRRNELMLDMKLAEEKYVQAEKEKAMLEIKNERKDEGLVVIERAFIPGSPDYPRLPVCLAVPVLLLLAATAALLAVIDRRKWISLHPAGGRKG